MSRRGRSARVAPCLRQSFPRRLHASFLGRLFLSHRLVPVCKHRALLSRLATLRSYKLSGLSRSDATVDVNVRENESKCDENDYNESLSGDLSVSGREGAAPN